MTEIAQTANFRGYFSVLAACLAAYMTIAAAINYWVDPWEIWRSLPPYIKVPQEITFEHITLAHNIRNAEPIDVLMLGSSRARYLLTDGVVRDIDPSRSRKIFGNQHVFQAAMAGSNIYHMRRVFEHALHYHPIRELVFLVDDVMLNMHRPRGGWRDYNYYGSSTYQTPLERALSLVDFPMLEASVRLIVENLKPRADAGAKTQDAVDIDKYWRGGVGEFSRKDLYGCYVIGDKQREDLDRILDLAARNNVRVMLITPFIHPALFEYFYRSDQGAGVKEYLSTLTDAAVRFQVPLWFFSPYSAITNGTPHLFNTDPAFFEQPDFYDPGHANYAIGTRILEVVLLGAEHAELQGFRLDILGVENVLDQIKTIRERWIAKNEDRYGDFIRFIPLTAGQACADNWWPK